MTGSLEQVAFEFLGIYCLLSEWMETEANDVMGEAVLGEMNPEALQFIDCLSSKTCGFLQNLVDHPCWTFSQK